MKKETEGSVRPMALTIKAVVLRNKDQVLLLRRIKKCLNGNKWDLPGGHIDKNETIEKTIERELQEETGLKVEMGEIIGAVEFPKENKLFKQEKRGLRFLAHHLSGEVKLNKKEHDKHEWLPIDEAIEKLNEKDGFENEKRETLIKAKEYLEMKNSLDSWKRSVAEFENYKKRMAKNNEEFRKYAAEDLILEILPVLDNFDVAIEHAPKDQKDNGWMMGILHIRKQLMDILENKGVEEIAVEKGKKIDEAIHEIVSGKAKKGKVGKVLKKGYKIADRVIRPASIEAE